MFGIFTERSPRELIEGYTDPLIQSLTTMPIFKGGDNTQSPFLSIITAPTAPVMNKIAFFMGTDDTPWSYLMTRSYAKWIDSQYINMLKNDYTSLNVTVPILVNPWLEQVPLNGTDGNQLHPNVQNDEEIVCFVNQFARPAYLAYNYSDWDSYKDGFHNAIELMVFNLNNDKMFLSQDSYPPNKKFNTRYNGTINMSTVMGAQAVGSKGHFLLATEDKILAPLLPLIYDHNGNLMPQNPDVDDTFVGLERKSGVVLHAKQRL